MFVCDGVSPFSVRLFTLFFFPDPYRNVYYLHRYTTTASNIAHANKMQWRRQTSPPMPPPTELDETHASTLILTHWHHYESMTSSTKPAVHNALHCRQRRTEPRPQVTYTENLVNLDVRFLRYGSRQTDKQTEKRTHRHANGNTLHP